MSLTPSQRKEALAYLANVSDDTLAHMTWWAVGNSQDISAEVAEVAAIHCDNTVRESNEHINEENEAWRKNACQNVASYSAHAIVLRSLHTELEVEVNAELVGAGS